MGREGKLTQDEKTLMTFGAWRYTVNQKGIVVYEPSVDATDEKLQKAVGSEKPCRLHLTDTFGNDLDSYDVWVDVDTNPEDPHRRTRINIVRVVDHEGNEVPLTATPFRTP